MAIAPVPLGREQIYDYYRPSTCGHTTIHGIDALWCLPRGSGKKKKKKKISMEWLWFFPIVSLPVTAAVASASQMRHVQEGNKGYEQQQ
jgi:hypothetical protein